MKNFFRKIALVLAIAMVFTAMPISAFANTTCTDGHHYNPNYYWSTEEYSHRHACDRCGYADKDDPHADTNPADGKCDVCEVIVANIGNNNYVHTHNYNVFGGVWENQHYYNCYDEKCMQREWKDHTNTNGDNFCDVCGSKLDANNKHICEAPRNSEWQMDGEGHWKICLCGERILQQKHADPDGDGLCGCGYEFCTHPEPRKDSEGNIVFGVGPMGHNMFCAVCDEPYGAEMHTAGNVLVSLINPDTNKEGHAYECDKCGAPAIHTFEEHSPEFNDDGTPRYYSDDQGYHYEHCSVCHSGIESTKAPHVAGNKWRAYSEEQHIACCVTCDGEVPGVLENHTGPNENGVCSKCDIPVDANGVHKHEVDNVWYAEWIEHVKRCNICGIATEMDFHTDANNDSKCDVCNATVEAITEDGENIDYVHEHNFGDAVSIGIYDHRYGCYGCDEYIYEPHIDENDDKTCDMCGVVYVVEIDAPSNSDYYTETNEIDDSYVDNFTEDEKTAFYEAVYAIIEVAGDNTLNAFEITCKDNGTDNEVSEPDTKFVFTVTLPADVIEVPQGKKIEWVMYRYHVGNDGIGKVDELPITDNGDGTGYFESDKFSVYVLGFKFLNTTHSHVWGYNTQHDAAAHWNSCQICGEKGAFVPHSDENKDGFCICGWPMTTTNRQNPNTSVTAEMLGRK